MKTVAEHKNECLSVSAPLPPFDVTLANAVGCMLAADVRSLVDMPQVDLAARNGYAVRATDIIGASPLNPVRLPVASPAEIVDAGAGSTGAKVAVPVLAGAPLPPGTDAVVSAEYMAASSGGGLNTGATPREVEVLAELSAGVNVRRRAEDLAAGQVILQKGVRIGSRQVAVLASGGHYSVLVHPKPRVVILSVGDELQEPGKMVTPGKVYDANSHTLAAAATDAGAEVFRVGALPDDAARLRQALEDQLVRADIILTTGGIGGDGSNVLRQVLESFGDVHFDTVAIAPGETLGVGAIENTTVFCLPGDPVAAVTNFEIFIRPALRKMAGYTHTERRLLQAKIIKGWESPLGRQEFVPAKVVGNPGRGYTVEAVAPPGQSLLSGLSRANCLMVIPAEAELVSVGVTLDCIVLDR